jgi:hypothetical protein
MKIYKVTFAILTSLVFILSSCEEEIKKPHKFIEQEQMVDVLVDLSLAEGTRALARRNNNKKDLHKLTVDQYYNLVFDKYGITREQYDSINDYYTHFPEKYEEIYKKVINKLNMIEAKEKENVKRANKKMEEEMKNRRLKDAKKELPKR